MSALKSLGLPFPDVPASLVRFDDGPLWGDLLYERPLNVPADLVADLLQSFKQIIGACDSAAPGEPQATEATAPTATGIAPRDAWFVTQWEARGTDTYHKPAKGIR